MLKIVNQNQDCNFSNSKDLSRSPSVLIGLEQKVTRVLTNSEQLERSFLFGR